ncbi:hypothetical protein [Fuerstiella marisgermanici]|uniref:ATP-grasp domain-containing protein n=1 Tax=Fuerstiella marisgermanici TaxID=1891926 RepID=A0A1P8WJN7_9PLAN|nr:hypothetical protein [Fuerstiella marisgermanici]APZ94267.1 hypothetical protein Fuma_03892 [Fuerstiella marisgermanici]
MKLLIPNFNFEDQLLQRATKPTPQTHRALAELAPLMALLADNGDVVQCPQAVDRTQFPPSLNHAKFSVEQPTCGADPCRVLPWGWTRETVESAIACGMPSQQIPSLDAVRLINSREFNARFDEVADGNRQHLPFGTASFGTECFTLDEWQSAVKKLAAFGYDRWAAKPQFSHAGRNRLLAQGTSLNPAQLGWLNKQLRDPRGVYLEPWVQPLEQAGLQFEVIRDEAGGVNIGCVGVTQLLTDHVGRYFGSLIQAGGIQELKWQTAVDYGHRVCREAAAAGYFGPIGIDAFQFRDSGGAIATRLCNDINGRYTMGRLALQLRKKLPPGQTGLWCQVATGRFSGFPETLPEWLQQWGFPDVEAEVTSPQVIGNASVATSTVLFAGTNKGALLKLAETLQAPRKTK